MSSSQCVEVGEELTVFISQSKDCYLCCSVLQLDAAVFCPNVWTCLERSELCSSNFLANLLSFLKKTHECSVDVYKLIQVRKKNEQRLSFIG